MCGAKGGLVLFYYNVQYYNVQQQKSREENARTLSTFRWRREGEWLNAHFSSLFITASNVHIRKIIKKLLVKI